MRVIRESELDLVGGGRLILSTNPSCVTTFSNFGKTVGNLGGSALGKAYGAEIGGVLGTAAGSVVGAPVGGAIIGAAAGAKYGGKAGGAAGGYVGGKIGSAAGNAFCGDSMPNAWQRSQKEEDEAGYLDLAGNMGSTC